MRTNIYKVFAFCTQLKLHLNQPTYHCAPELSALGTKYKVKLIRVRVHCGITGNKKQASSQGKALTPVRTCSMYSSMLN